jgi:hypothetical protein
MQGATRRPRAGKAVGAVARANQSSREGPLPDEDIDVSADEGDDGDSASSVTMDPKMELRPRFRPSSAYCCLPCEFGCRHSSTLRRLWRNTIDDRTLVANG